jgi:hypothetical protein
LLGGRPIVHVGAAVAVRIGVGAAAVGVGAPWSERTRYFQPVRKSPVGTNRHVYPLESIGSHGSGVVPVWMKFRKAGGWIW